MEPLLPTSDCPLCPRLVAFRQANQSAYPDFYNGAVPSFGSIGANLLVVGLAPGLKGANATGRPFTGDYAGDVLYEALEKCGLTEGKYAARADDGFALKRVRITNAARCVPPENKPTPAEVKQCIGFLRTEIMAMPALKAILCLGQTSHNAVLKALGAPLKLNPFGHATHYQLPVNGRNVHLLSSYHTSRYNINTGRLNREMFLQLLQRTQSLIV
jgi:uracil-DNA glycosylase family 4